VLAIVGLVLGFALVYPKLCALAGFDLASMDPLGEIAKMVPEQNHTGPSPLRIVQILYALFLACGPMVAMVVTLLCVTWMFTFIEMDPKTKAITFPARLFTLPVSTPFLFLWLLLGGMTAIAGLFDSWVYFVPLPHLDMFITYQTCFGWMTLLALAQGIVWSLDAWPITRALVVAAVFFCFLCAPARRDIFDSPMVLPSLFVLGVALARLGLQKMRHGQWQGWIWQWPWATWAARAELRGPKRFVSPAQAQLWFEWRRFARRLCFYAAGLAFVPLIILLPIRFVAGVPLHDDDLGGLVACLMGIPLLLHFCFAISPAKTDLPFLMNRPLTNGQMMMATLKAATLSTVCSWALVFVALGAVPLLGDFHALVHDATSSPPGPTIIVVGLMLLTWRLIPLNLGFVLSGNRRLASAPVWMLLGLYLVGIILAVMTQDEEFWNAFFSLLPSLLAGLLALKFLLALLAFRVSLKRRLIAPSALVSYLGIWVLLTVVLLTLFGITVAIYPLEKTAVLPLCLGIILLVPLARIGFCPIALSWNRHT
jgi:hypothetical protein